MADPRFGLDDLDGWARQGLITDEQAARIRSAIAAAPPAAPPRRFDMVTVAYYFGGFTILLAYTLFMGRQWEQLGHGGQTAISTITVAALCVIGFALRRRGLTLPGDLVIFAGVGIVPLAVYSAEKLLGIADIAAVSRYGDYYRVVAPAWVMMELVSIAAALVALRLTGFPLLMLLFAHWSWFLSLDGARWLARSPEWSWGEREHALGLAIGLVMLAAAVVARQRTRRNYSVWLYLYGFPLVLGSVAALVSTSSEHDLIELLAVGLGLVMLGVGVRLLAWERPVASTWFFIFGHLLVIGYAGELALRKEGLAGVAFLVLYLGVVAASVVLQSRIFLVFGALGCYAYVSYLAFKLFADTLGFPFALGAIGLVIVLSAVGYERVVRQRIEEQLGRFRRPALGPRRHTATGAIDT